MDEVKSKIARHAVPIHAGVVLLCVCVPVIAAAAEKTVAAVDLGAPPSAAGGLAQMTIGLLVVLLAIGAAAWALRRFGRLQTSASGALRILGGLSLGPRERVVLMQVGETQLLLGIAPGRVQTLHVLTQPVTLSDGAASGDGFAGRLANAMRRAAGKTD